MDNLQNDGYLLRTYKDRKGKLNAYLKDYANYADGLIELFQISGGIKYLKEAKRLADLMISEFEMKQRAVFSLPETNTKNYSFAAKTFTIMRRRPVARQPLTFC